MDNQSNESRDYRAVIDIISGMFGKVMSLPAITSVVESYDGNLDLSVDAIMKITEVNETKTKNNDIVTNGIKPSISQESQLPSTMNNIVKSYAEMYKSTPSGVSSSTGAVPKHSHSKKASFDWTDQLKRIVLNHNAGSRVFIIMRGLPGSGKSYLAKQVIDITLGVEETKYKSHIFSSDDYFFRYGRYEYNRGDISAAHSWNQNRVLSAAYQGVSPIIVDNTNVEAWEMKPYMEHAVENGYFVEIMEPKNKWSMKVHQLAKKNVHDVPLHTIKRMFDNFQQGLSASDLMNFFELCYPENMVPPVKRKTPALPSPKRYNLKTKSIGPTVGLQEIINKNQSPTKPDHVVLQQETKVVESQSSNITEEPINSQNVLPDTETDLINNATLGEISTCITDANESITITSDKKSSENIQQVVEAQKKVEEIEKFTQDWENGESWEEIVDATTENESENAIALEPKPQRRNSNDSATKGKTLFPDNNDWCLASASINPWEFKNGSNVHEEPAPRVETVSSGTSMDNWEADSIINDKNYKVLIACLRDINENYMPLNVEKIPLKRMLDKSTMINDDLIMQEFSCKHSEKHFNSFRKMFKNIPRADLRDVFDNCKGDVNWAVNLVVDGMSKNNYRNDNTEEESDEDDNVSGQCDCLAFYNIVPKTSSLNLQNEATVTEVPNSPTVLGKKKTKKESTLSDASLQLKREIEQNVFISDQHYSPHCLKIKKLRHGDNNEEPTEGYQDIAQALEPEEVDVVDVDEENEYVTDADVLDDSEKVVTVNLGMEFVKILDDLFGRKGMEYPETIVPKVSIRLSMLNEINALWMESMMHQLDEEGRQSAYMIKQDEEFARQMAIKEEEFANSGIQPPAPDFKEIMDLDLALSIYQKDVNEWRSNEPNDLAAKLTREKLYNLFPEVEQNVLSELLMAHEHCFEKTVESLLVSTGRCEILAEEKGVQKFILEGEMHRKGQILIRERKLLEVNLCSNLPDFKADLNVVDIYRGKASKHMERRNKYHMKAQGFANRGILCVANYYSEVANYHKVKFEESNRIAVASLLQYHSERTRDNSTIDLHYLRVQESLETMDVFIDGHIQVLRETLYGGPKNVALYFITGRGLHSPGKPRVKPAVYKRLLNRGLAPHERNPGLLCARVSARSVMTHEIS